jgi:hypothetical protein
LQFFELVSGAVVFAEQGGFVAGQFAEGVAAVGVAHVGPGALAAQALRFHQGIGSLIHDQAEIEDGRFEGHDAVVADAGFGHALDQEVFVGVLGIEFFADLRDHVKEVVGIFVGEHAGFGSKAVPECVAAGFSFAFRGFGSGGFLRISAVCVYLRLGGHNVPSTSSYPAGVARIGGESWKVLEIRAKFICRGCDSKLAICDLGGLSRCRAAILMLC